MCVPRSIDPSETSPIKSRLSVLGSVLPTLNAIMAVCVCVCVCVCVGGGGGGEGAIRNENFVNDTITMFIGLVSA